jgi:glycosyltransferase involved in cell wall biosynthesis
LKPTVEFWSSVELGGFMYALLTTLADAGWDVRQRFEVSIDDYRGARTGRQRLGLRWRSYASYIHTLGRRLRCEPPPSVLVICTNTFYAPAMGMLAASRAHVPVVHWIFDLYPDVLVEAGSLRREGTVTHALGRLTRATLQHAARNVFLGERLRAFAGERYGAPRGIPRATVIPVGADGRPFAGAPPVERPPGTPLRILYCGNFGRMHESETITALLRAGRPRGWQLAFRGAGVGLRVLESTARALDLGDTVTFGPSLPDGRWEEEMRAADLALVTMKPGAENLVMPSKTYSALVAGQAIVAVCPVTSDLAATVRRHDAGWVVPPGDPAGLGAVLARAVARPDEVLAKRRRAYEAGHSFYDQRVLGRSWDDLLRSITRDPHV